MRYLTVVLIAIFGSTIIKAQTYEAGLYGGGANYIGDVGSTTFIAPNAPVIGGILKWNRSNRHSFRFSALFAQLEGNDEDSDDNRRQQRGLEFSNSIIELSLGLEYTFWEFDLFKDRNPSTPYLYTGITVINQDDLTINEAGDTILSVGGSWDFVIPMVIGYKIALNTKFILALEVGARYALSDNLDGSFPENNSEVLSFGNINNDDWYMFTGFTLTYTFGRKPCFCAF